MILQVWIDDRTEAALTEAAAELGRTVDGLAEAAVSEAACNWRRAKDMRARPETDGEG